MEREIAIQRLEKLIGNDLLKLANQYEVTVFKNGKKNKGWAGHVIERYLGLPINSAQSPNFGSWELKTASLKYLKNGKLTIKETMAITMLDDYNIRTTPFEDSHLLSKMKKILIVSRIWNEQAELSSNVYGIHTFDIGNNQIYSQIKDDYNLVRDTIIKRGYNALSGRMGKFIQPRTKGAGHGSISRAFYAKKIFLKEIIKL